MGTWNIGSMSGRETEVCEELRKRRMDVCCLQGVQFLGLKGRRYKLSWSGKSDGTRGEGGAVRKSCGGVKEE